MLLDDELPGLSYLKMLCEQLPELEVVRAYDNPAALLKDIPTLEFDLCILDIEMPGMNGLQVTNLLKGKPVIFATAYREYAAEAFDLNAVDYIRKPIKLERLQQAIRKAAKYINNREINTSKPFIQLNTDQGKVVLFFDKIGYIRTSETDSRDKVARLFDGEEFVLKNITFDQLLHVLPTADFCRVNKKEVLALKAVQFFSYDEITTNLTLSPGRNLKLTLSETYRNGFLERVTI